VPGGTTAAPGAIAAEACCNFIAVASVVWAVGVAGAAWVVKRVEPAPEPALAANALPARELPFSLPAAKPRPGMVRDEKPVERRVINWTLVEIDGTTGEPLVPPLTAELLPRFMVAVGRTALSGGPALPSNAGDVGLGDGESDDEEEVDEDEDEAEAEAASVTVVKPFLSGSRWKAGMSSERNRRWPLRNGAASCGRAVDPAGAELAAGASAGFERPNGALFEYNDGWMRVMRESADADAAVAECAGGMLVAVRFECEPLRFRAESAERDAEVADTGNVNGGGGDGGCCSHWCGGCVGTEGGGTCEWCPLSTDSIGELLGDVEADESGDGDGDGDGDCCAGDGGDATGVVSALGLADAGAETDDAAGPEVAPPPSAAAAFLDEADWLGSSSIDAKASELERLW